MKKIIFLLLCFFIFVTTIVAQTRWHSESYQKINHTNFRNQPLFLRKLEKHLDYRILNAVLFYLTNELRVKNNKPLLEYHETLEVAAWNHAVAMAQSRFFGHLNPKEAQRRTLESRGSLAGIINPFLKETLGYIVNEKVETYIAIGERFLTQWKSKKEFADILLSEDNIQLGCGMYFYQNKWYAVQVLQGFEEIKTKAAVDKLPN